MGKTLTPKQQRFVDEYLVDLNATQAAFRAGYSPNVANRQGSENLSKPVIAAAIAAAQAARSQRTELTADRVLSEVDLLAHSDVTHYVVDERTGAVTLAPHAPPNAMRAVRSIKHRISYGRKGEVTSRAVELTLWDKTKALDLEGSHLSLWKKKFEVQQVAPLFALPGGIEPDVGAVPRQRQPDSGSSH